MRYPNKTAPLRLGIYTQKIVNPIFKTRGLIEGKIVTHWSQIVGEKFSYLSLPEKITFPKGKKNEGTLHLTVTSAGALLLHAVQDLVLEKVNTFFGYKAVARLRLTHGLIPSSPPAAAPPRSLSQETRAWIDQQTYTLEDCELKQCLEKLGAAICEDLDTGAGSLESDG